MPSTRSPAGSWSRRSCCCSIAHEPSSTRRSRSSRCSRPSPTRKRFAPRCARSPDEVMVALGLGELDDVLEAETRRSDRARRVVHDDPSAQMLARRGVNEAMVALLRGESRMIGSLMVGRAPRRPQLRQPRPPTVSDARDPYHGDPREQPHGALDRAAHGAPGTADASGVPRLAHRPRQPIAVRSAHRSGVAAQRRGQASVAVIFLDIDDFKGVNDTLGHAAGDALLVEVAARIRACLRRPDTAARLGGDEFALLIEGVDSASKPRTWRVASSRSCVSVRRSREHR